MAFAEPRTGIHNIRIFDIAIVDVLITLLASYIMSRYSSYNPITIFIILIILSIPIHTMLNIKTKTNVWLM